MRYETEWKDEIFICINIYYPYHPVINLSLYIVYNENYDDILLMYKDIDRHTWHYFFFTIKF